MAPQNGELARPTATCRGTSAAALDTASAQTAHLSMTQTGGGTGARQPLFVVMLLAVALIAVGFVGGGTSGQDDTLITMQNEMVSMRAELRQLREEKLSVVPVGEAQDSLEESLGFLSTTSPRSRKQDMDICAGDLNRSGQVSTADLLLLLSSFGADGCPEGEAAAGGGGDGSGVCACSAELASMIATLQQAAPGDGAAAPPPAPPPPPPRPLAESPWETQFDSTLERSDQTAQYRLSQCPGEPYAWMGSFINGELPTGATLAGSAYLDGRFGAVLGGDGDHITIGPAAETVAYAASGEFSISMWFTKRECADASANSGRYETIYRQTAGTERRSFGEVFRGDTPNAITMFVGCSAAGVRSTLDGDIVRTVLVDSESNRATFDWSVDNERGGGFVTDKWVHMVLSVSSTMLQVFLDGEPVETFGYGQAAPPGSGDSGSYDDMDWAQTVSNFAYIGRPVGSLQGMRAPRTLGTFDMTGAISIGGDRGYSAFTGEMALISLYAAPVQAEAAQCIYFAGEGLVGVCSNLDDPATGGARVSWIVHQDPARVSQDVTLEGDAQLQGSTGELGVMLDGSNDQIKVSGATASLYAQDGAFGVSMWFSRSECEANTQSWTRSTTLFAQNKGGTGWGQFQATDGSGFVGTGACFATDPTDEPAPDCSDFQPGDPSSCAADGCSFGSNTNVNILLVCPSSEPSSTIEGPLVRITLGDDEGGQVAVDFSYSVFDASPARSGKQWAHLLLSVDHSSVEVYIDGQPVTEFGFPLDYMSDTNLAYNGEDMTSAIVLDADRGLLGGFSLAGYDITIGAMGNRREFSGNVAMVSLHADPVTGTDADCLYQYGEQQVAMCEDYASGGWRGPLWLLFNGTMHDQAELGGDAVLDAEFGVMLDGQGDYVSVQPQGSYSSSLNYAKDAQFGVSLWFTRKTCPVAGRYEALYTHAQETGRSSSWSDPTNSGIHILVGCAGGDSFFGEHSSIPGDILRFIFVDDQQNRLTFDVPLAEAPTNGNVASNWIHLAVAVDTTSVQVFLNGLLVPDSDVGFATDPPADYQDQYTNQWAWATAAGENLAYPTPSALSRPLNGFGMSGIGDNTDYYTDMTLDAGAHYFRAIDKYGDGWQGGWFQVMDGPCSAADSNVLVGAPAGTSTTSGAIPAVGAPEGAGGVYAFVLPGDAPTTVCVHLHTGDWASEYDWNFDGDTETAMVSPEPASIVIGARSGWSSFMGGIAAVSVHGSALSELDAECLWNFGSDFVAICPDVSRSSYGQQWVVFNGTLNTDAQLRGDAFMDSDMGVSLDGDGDYVSVGGETSTTYSHDGTFSISLWATRGECNVPGSYEMLYGHQESRSRWSGNWLDPENVNIHLLLGCGSQGSHSTLDGDVIRTLLVDDEGQRVAFDWSLSNEKDNGAVNKLWVHIVLSVSSTAVRTFVDGAEVTEFGYPMGGWQGQYDLATTEANLAYPDGPGSLSEELAGFGISKYADNEDYFVPVTLDAGEHVLHGVDTFGDGWQGGWMELLDSDGQVVTGGAETGAVPSDTLDIAFVVPRSNSGEDQVFTVHIHTGRWGNEVAWSLDDGIVTDEDTGETSGYGGPRSTSDITLGGNGYGGFQGQLGGVSIVSHAVKSSEARCLYESGAQFVGLCPNFESRWRSEWLVMDTGVHEKAEMHGDAMLNGKFGLTLDGSGDYLTVSGEDVISYASSGEFGVSMWFTRRECLNPGRYEMLFGHHLDEGYSFWSPDTMLSSSSVHIFVGCADSGVHSTLSGDIVRTLLVDDASPRQRMSFDWSLAAAADNGPANRDWVHMVLSVMHGSTQVFVDGLPASSYGFGLDDPNETDPTRANANQWMRTMENLAYEASGGQDVFSGPIVMQNDHQWGGFGLSGYGDNTDYYEPVDLDAGDHIFHAIDQWGDGWQGGYFEVLLCTGPARAPCAVTERLLGGEEEGTVQGDGKHLSFSLEADSTIHVHLNTGSWASEVSWSINKGGRGMEGPTASHTVSVGGQDPGWSTFMGEIQAVSLHREGLTQHDVSCLRDFGENHLAMCPKEMGRGSWSNNWVIMNGTVSDDAILKGDANIDNDATFGVNFDGENDALVIGGNDASSYAQDGTFAISFWFTKRECDIPGRYEELFHQSERDGYGGYWSGSTIIITIGCASAGVHSTITGDIVRTLLRDADGKTVSFDWSIAEESSNGYVNSMWAHLVLSVDKDSVMAYVDGEAVTNFGFQTDGRGFKANSDDNLAYPDGPATLSDSLGRFPVGSTYKDDDHYWIPVSLDAGSHIFHAVDTYGDGWQGGWVEMVDSHGVRVFGGEDEGAPENDGADYSFEVTEDSAYTVHIKTGRWASEYQWSIDEGSTLLEDGSVDTSTGYSGPPPVHSIVIGDGGRTGFYGSINTMALHRSPQSAEDAMCLYEFGKSWVAMCQDPTRTWSIDWLVSDEVSDGATMGGDATFDGEFGLVFDGDGDYVTFDGDEIIQYAADASFGISLWFTRQTCSVRNGWVEMIYSHQVGDGNWWDSEDTRIFVMVGCADSGTHSTVGGNIVRTEMQDGAGNQLSFDWSIPEGNSESYTNEWVHMVLAVEPTAIRVYADGERITDFGYEMPRVDWGEDYAPLSPELNLANPNPGNLTAELQGFTLQGYADQADFLIDVMLPEGVHTFHAVDQFGDGWQGGFFEVGYDLGIMVNGRYVPGQQPTLLVGGVDDGGSGPGAVVTDGQHLSFRVDPGETRTLQVHIKTGDWASEYSWSIDDGSDFKGPPAPNPLQLGGGGSYSSFMGSIGAVSLHRNAPSDHDAECMYEYGQSLVSLCQDFTGQDNWRINWLLMNGTASPDVAMSGDTYLDGSFGAVFDGRGDSLTVVGDSTTYASDGTFGLSFWFTKHQCSVPGRYEMLWRHEQNGWRSSSVHVYIGCGAEGVDSTIDGDIIRTVLVDGDDKRVSFDWGVSSERSNGAVNSEWVHMVLSVDHDSVQAFVDGQPVSDYGYDLGRRSWAQTDRNLAWPDGPTQLTGRLGGFPISAGYEASKDYYVTVELAPGDHTFSAWADWGSWHGGWFSVTTQSGEVIAGGEDDKPDKSENLYSFTVAPDASISATGNCLLTLRITTGRWASDISWAFDVDADGQSEISGPPASHSVSIAGTGYLGSMNSISIHRSPLAAKDAECLYDFGMQYVEICRDFTSDMIIANDMISDDVSFVGNANVDGRMGVRLDGDDDAIVVDGPSTYYAASGEFSISLWMTKNECVKPGRWEMLWSHQEYGGWRGWRRGSSIHMYVRCGNDGDSTVSGNLIRTSLRDDSGQLVSFDFSTSEEADNGYVFSQWVHLALTVSHETVQMYVDGKAVQRYGYGTARCAVGSDCTDCGNCPADGGPRTNNDDCEYLGIAGAVSNDGECDEPTEQTDANLAWCAGDAVDGVCTGPLELSAPLGGFAMGGYGDNQDYYVDMVLEAGDHIFHGQDTFGDGWQGGYFEMTQIEPGCYADAGVPSPDALDCQCHYSCGACGYGGENYAPDDPSDCITCADGSPVTPVWGDGTGTCSFSGQQAPPPMSMVGGEQDGTVDGDWGHWAFSLAQQTVVTLHLHTGDWAVEYAWSVEGAGCAETGPGDDMPGCNGPTGHAMSIGGSVRDSGVSGAYFGAVSLVSVHNNELDAEDVDCLNQFGSGMIEVCRDPSDSWTTEWVFFNGTLYNDAQLNGDAYVDPRAGVIVDGDGDAIAVGGDLAATYAPDADFSISMWFTRRECTERGRLEMLYAHTDASGDGSWWRGTASHIHIYIGCAQQGDHSTLDGDIVRTSMADREGNRMSFDWPIAAELSGGLVNNMWVHMILSVSPGSVQVFADGNAISEYGFQIDSRSSGWVTTSDNMAWPDGPVDLPSRLQGFGMGSAYAWNEDYFIPLVVPAGDHTFHGWSTSRWTSGWNGGWFELIGSNGDILIGGVEAGKISGEDDEATFNADTTQNDFDFTIDEGQTVTLHIKTARWANYMEWSISADPQLNAPDPVFSGPPEGEPFYVGGAAGWLASNSFSGTIASVAIDRRSMDAKSAHCMYEFGLNNMEICADPSRRMHHLVFNGNATGDGMENNVATMFGNAYFEGTQLMLDGIGDLIGVSGDIPLQYSNGGDFSLSMWFTRKECIVAGQAFEQLYYHDSDAAIAGESDSKVSVFIGCSTPAGPEVSTLVLGDVVRTVLDDVDGNRAVFDWSIAAERSTGVLNHNWVHMLLSVNNAPDMEQPYVQVFVDGAPVRNFGFPPDQAMASNMAYTCGTPICASDVLNLNPMMGAFGMGGYADRSAYHVQLTDLADGPHQFHGMDSSRDGWEGGYYTICVGQCDPNDAAVVVLAGGRDSGRPTGSAVTFPEFVKEAGVDLWLMINTGDYANEISWDITNSEFAYPPADGSGSSMVYLGGCSPAETDPEHCSAGPFLGSIAMVSLIYDDRDAAEADCIYQWSKDFIELCPDLSTDRGTSFVLKWEDGLAPEGVALSAGATVSAPRAGLNLDGSSYATLNGGSFAGGDSEFTLSVWFTKAVCENADQDSTSFTLLAQDEVGDQSRSYISAQVLCGGLDSSLRGDVIRVSMQDVNGVVAMVDLPMENDAALSGGIITDQWLNLAWTVASGEDDDGSYSSIQFFVDGTAVRSEQIGWPLAGQAANIAHPSSGGGSPSRFSAQFGDFNMDSSYPDNEDSFVSITGLSPSVTYSFTGFDEWGDGWDLGGWFEVIVTSIDGVSNVPGSNIDGERILGGPTAGQVEGSGGVPVTFTMPQECGEVGECTITVRIAVKRAGNEISWEMRDTTDDSVIGSGPQSAPLYLGAMPVSIPSSEPCPSGAVCGPNGQQLADLFVGEIGSVVAWRWDRGFDPSCLWQAGPMSTPPGAPAPPPGASSLTPVTTVAATSIDASWSTYTLSASLDASVARNLYSIYGVAESPMSAPPAYQCPSPFGSDVGGTNPAFWAFANSDALGYAQFDSWLTAGVTDGNAGSLSSIGIDWEGWSEAAGIETSDGALFWMAPDDAPGGDVVVAQLTVPAGSSGSFSCGAQGRSAGESDTPLPSNWVQDNIMWSYP